MSQESNALLQHQKEQTDYLVALLIDFFRKPENETDFLGAAKIALNLLGKNNDHAPRLKRGFYQLSGKLKNNISPQGLRFFAMECIDALGAPSNMATNDQSMPSKRGLRKIAQKDISLALLGGHSPDAALNRAAIGLLKTKQKRDQNQRISNLMSTHPLKDTLLACNVLQTRLAKEDIKHHFLRLGKENKKGGGVLFGLLAKASCFSAYRLNKLLGDELFFLCRPVGFFDQTQTTILIEVPTNAHVHALTYRKLDILRALRKDTAFSQVKNLRFKVSQNLF